MYLRSRYHVKESLVLMRTDNFIHKELYKVTSKYYLRHIVMVQTRLEPRLTAYVSDALTPIHIFIYDTFDK